MTETEITFLTQPAFIRKVRGKRKDFYLLSAFQIPTLTQLSVIVYANMRTVVMSSLVVLF